MVTRLPSHLKFRLQAECRTFLSHEVFADSFAPLVLHVRAEVLCLDVVVMSNNCFACLSKSISPVILRAA